MRSGCGTCSQLVWCTQQMTVYWRNAWSMQCAAVCANMVVGSGSSIGCNFFTFVTNVNQVEAIPSASVTHAQGSNNEHQDDVVPIRGRGACVNRPSVELLGLDLLHKLRLSVILVKSTKRIDGPSSHVPRGCRSSRRIAGLTGHCASRRTRGSRSTWNKCAKLLDTCRLQVQNCCRARG